MRLDVENLGATWKHFRRQTLRETCADGSQKDNSCQPSRPACLVSRASAFSSVRTIFRLNCSRRPPIVARRERGGSPIGKAADIGSLTPEFGRCFPIGGLRPLNRPVRNAHRGAAGIPPASNSLASHSEERRHGSRYEDPLRNVLLRDGRGHGERRAGRHGILPLLVLPHLVGRASQTPSPYGRAKPSA